MKIVANQPITYTARSKEQKDAEKKVVAGGGAIAAATSVARTRAVKSSFDMFGSAKKITSGITSTTRMATQVTKKSTGLWAKIVKNAKWAKNAILKWGDQFKNTKWIKPVINSPLFKKCAGFLGYGFGAVTLISGLTDIANVALDAADGKILTD